jgi:hypothetical protein
MLEKLLTELRTNGLSSAASLAEKLDTTPQMVTAMLDQLERMGYLRTIQESCEGGSCGACAVNSFCTSSIGEKAKVRLLTDKEF